MTAVCEGGGGSSRSDQPRSWESVWSLLCAPLSHRCPFSSVQALAEAAAAKLHRATF